MAGRVRERHHNGTDDSVDWSNSGFWLRKQAVLGNGLRFAQLFGSLTLWPGSIRGIEKCLLIRLKPLMCLGVKARAWVVISFMCCVIVSVPRV